MGLKKKKSFPLPPRGDGGSSIAGTAFDVKCFPDSKSGLGGPFREPTTLPASGNSAAWMRYFIKLVGAKLEKLNGLQFDLDQNQANDQDIADELGRLADALKVGSGSNPQELRWPLAGSYTFAWSPADANDIGFSSFVVDVFFETNGDYYMVVNCGLQINYTKLAGIQPISSSSVYLATSSSR
jgi:hypothetical protein